MHLSLNQETCTPINKLSPLKVSNYVEEVPNDI